MVYEEFKRMNDESKKYFSSKMKIVDVDFEKIFVLLHLRVGLLLMFLF